MLQLSQHSCDTNHNKSFPVPYSDTVSISHYMAQTGKMNHVLQTIWNKVLLAYPHTCQKEMRKITFLIDNAPANIQTRHLPNTTSSMIRFLFFWDTASHQWATSDWQTDISRQHGGLEKVRQSHSDVATQTRWTETSNALLWNPRNSQILEHYCQSNLCSTLILSSSSEIAHTQI
jgi:hypothetical protein